MAPAEAAFEIKDAPVGVNQQYGIPQADYEASKKAQEQRQSQEHADAKEYVQDLIEKTSKVSDVGGFEEEEEEEEDE